MKRLLIHVTNIPTPYRTAFCNTLQEVLAAWGYGLHVLYCAECEPNRTWVAPFHAIHYPYEVLPGISPQLGGFYTHVNPGVIRRLKQLQPELLLIAGSWNMPTALMAASRRLCGTAFRVFWSEGHADAVRNPSGLIAWLRRRSLHAYNAFAVPNETAAQFLAMELGFRPPVLPLPNTIAEEFYAMAQEMDKGRLRATLDLPIDATVFVSVTRLNEEKGVRELVQAMAKLHDLQRPCILVLVGDGPLRAELTTMSHNGQTTVRVVGSHDATGVRSWLAAADAFVLASKRDPNPLAVIEAAFAGLPLLVSHKAGNVRELVHDGVSGFTIPALDSSTIAATLRRFCHLEDTARCQLGAGAAQLAQTGFSRNVVVQNFVTALLEQRNKQ